MARRTLQASGVGIQAIKKALKRKQGGQTYLAGTVGCSRQTIWSLLQGNPIDCDVFMAICAELNLNWEEIALPEAAEPEVSEDDRINAFAQEIREQIRPLIQEQCGTMRMLEVGQVPVDQIYVQLEVLKPPHHDLLFSEQRQSLQDEECDADTYKQHYNRLGWGESEQKPQPALKVLQDYPKAMILGRPGSGKSTLLRSLAVECIKSQPELEELKHYVPVFLILKDFVEDYARELRDKERLVLAKAIQAKLQSCGVIDQRTKTLLSAGKLLVLLDGLDEVSQDYAETVITQIRQLCEAYRSNRILVTCRTQQVQYRFDNSVVDLAIADFNPDQVKRFVQHWFRLANKKDGQRLATQLISELEDPQNVPVAELAVIPILLNLVCVVARHEGALPKSRVELYEKGIKALLIDWDEFEGKQQRQRRSGLSIDEKVNLLSYIGLQLFEQNDSVPTQRTLEQLVAKKLDISLWQAETILESFETEHGLLVERERSYWSFSHLTFQEYFAAREIVESRDPEALQRLVAHITEPRWREVFLLTAGMLRNADHLVLLMKQEIDQILADNGRFQQVLIWLQEKSSSVELPYKPAALRAFYLTLDCVFSAPYIIPELDHPLSLALDFSFIHILDQTFTFDFDDAINSALALNNDFIVDCALNYAIDDALALYIHRDSFEFDGAFDYALGRACALDNILTLNCTLDLELHHELQKIRDQLPDPSEENREYFSEGWQANGQGWAEQLRAVMIEHRNIGHDWQFTDEQKAKLQQYYDANKLLVDCLNSGNVSSGTKEKIEETLLLPMSEIEKRRN